MRSAKQMWKRILIMLTYANMNIKRTWQGYGARLMLNKFKEMKGPILIYTPLGTYLKEACKEVFMCASSKEASWEPF